MELSATAYVILGMVSREPRSGYEIKAIVDQTTRFFWAASYGQIYPELKRLSEAGLIEGSDAPRGDRKRTVYEITADGEAELKDWLRRPPQTSEMREEGLLKLFFSGLLEPKEAAATLRDDARAPDRALRATARDGARKSRVEGPLPADGAAGRDRVQPVVRRLVRADGGSAARVAGGKERLMFDALARLADRRPRRIGLLAIAFFLIAGGVGGSVADRLDPYGADDPATETVEAREQLEDAGLRVPAVIVVVDDAPLADPATRARVVSLERDLRDRAEVQSVSGWYDTRSSDFVSRDGRATYLAVALKPTEDKAWQEAGADVADDLAGRPGITVGGAAVAQEQVNKQVEEDLRTAEMLAFPLLFLLSFLFFRSLVAALLPVMIGLLAIVGTFLILRIASEFGSISIFALNLTTGLGLGLAIDYSLFVVSRYREEIAKDGPGLAAMRRVLATAGRTVFFSSLTVAAALASLLVFPQRFLYSMGLGGSLVVLLAALISLTVLPAVLTLLGSRVNSLAPRFLQRRAEADARPDSQGFWYRLSRFVMRRPVPVATLSALFLIVLGLPFFGIKFNTVDPTVLPKEASARQAYDEVSAEFPPYRETPIWIAVDGAGAKEATALAGRIRRVEGVAAVAPPQRLRGGVSAIRAISESAFKSEASQSTVERIRAIPAPPGASVKVGGRHRGLCRLPGQPGPPPADRLRDHRRRDPGHPLPDDRLGGAAGQVADHERAQPERRLRPARVDLPGRQAGRVPRLHEPGSDRADDADPSLRGRLRPLDRLRGLPPLADQGGARQRCVGLGVGCDRARADREDRDRGRPPLRGGHWRLRDLEDHLHQGERGRHRARRADRRQHHPSPPRSLADGAAREVELVGAGALAAPTRPGWNPGGRCGTRRGEGKLTCSTGRS